jgi:hypothetical protein
MLLSQHTRRRTLLGVLAGALGAANGSEAWAQAARKVPKVGFAGSEVPLFEAFLAGLRELGWRPGDDVHVIHGGAASSFDVIDRLSISRWTFL